MIYLSSTPEIMDQHIRAVGTEKSHMQGLILNLVKIQAMFKPTIDIDPYGISIFTDIDE